MDTITQPYQPNKVGFAKRLPFTPPATAKGRRYSGLLLHRRSQFKTEVINRKGPWKSLTLVELATLDWVHWYNTERLLGPIGYIPPAEDEETYYAQLDMEKMVA